MEERILKSLNKKLTRVVALSFLLIFPTILSAQYIDTKWTVTGYFGELWFAEEEDIPGKHQELELINQEKAFSKVFEKMV